MKFMSFPPSHSDVKQNRSTLTYEEKLLKVANPTVNPTFVFFSAILSTYAMAIMAEDVFNDCQAIIIVGYIMRWIALALGYVLFILLMSVRVKGSHPLLMCFKRASPRMMLNIITILAVFGGSASFMFKALSTCGDYDYEGREPSCCNEHLSDSSGMLC